MIRQKITSSVLVLLLLCGLVVAVPQAVLATDASSSATPTPTSVPSQTQVNELNKKISDLESTISNLKSQENTLSSQIDVMDNQIKLTELRINSTQDQIAGLTDDIGKASTKISTLEETITSITKLLIGRIVATYQIGSIQPVQILFSSDNVSDFLSRLNYLRIVQAHDKQVIYDSEQARNDYQNQKAIYEGEKRKVEALKAQLETYTTQLDDQKKQKQDLLDETKGSESNYQRILAETKAQLAGFQSFVTSQGGASLLSGQTACDSWGCYYNQRDSQWGGNSLNGTNYTLADSGCLVTSMAMVYTHYGHKDVTPQSINSVSSNFAGIPAALLKRSVVANGVSSSRISASIDSTLSGGDPVIVGISYDGGPYPDHFVVLLSGSGGNYMMNDPFTPNGHDIAFTSHYSLSSIVEIDRVSM